MKYKISDVFDLQMGKTPDRNKAEYWNDGTEPWISIADMSKADIYIGSTKECISNLAVENSGIKIIPRNTVIMSFKLSIGKVAITERDMYSNEAIMAFIDKGVVRIIPEYLYYSLLSKDWNEGTNKAVMGKTLNKATLSQMKIVIHGFDEQRMITDKLHRLGDVIAQRRKQLEFLDTLIKARFVEMFGDPVVNSLCLSSMSMTELCEIIDGDRGKNYPKQEEFFAEGDCLFLNAKNVTSNGFVFKDCSFITKEKDRLLNKGKLKRGDVVLTTRGTIGNLAFYGNDVPYENVRINSGMVILRMNHSLLSEIFFIEQFRIQLQDIKTKIASGSAQPQLPISAMKNIKMVIAPLTLQEQFAAFVFEVDKSKAVVQKALDEAQLLFDSLMQKYFG